MSQPTTREVRLAMNVARETCKLSGLDGILHILDAAISKLESLADAEERQRPEQPEPLGTTLHNVWHELKDEAENDGSMDDLSPWYDMLTLDDYEVKLADDDPMKELIRTARRAEREHYVWREEVRKIRNDIDAIRQQIKYAELPVIRLQKLVESLGGKDGTGEPGILEDRIERLESRVDACEGRM